MGVVMDLITTGKLFIFSALLINLTSCGGSDSSTVPTPLPTVISTTITGSAGDGPVVGGAVSVTDANGASVATIPTNPTTDSQAKFSFIVPSATPVPLIITVTGGTDIVTGAVQDFPLTTAVVTLPENAVITGNANPLSTLIVESARAHGALTPASLVAANGHVLGAMSFGLAAATNPLSSAVSNANVANITRANEAAAEMIRRASQANASLSLSQTIQSIAQDLTDGVIDGYATTGATATLVSNVAAAHILNQQAQVAIETLANQLIITTPAGLPIRAAGGTNFTSTMNAAILATGNTGDITLEVPTQLFLNQTIIAIAIANTLAGGANADLNNLIVGVSALTVGTVPTVAQQNNLITLATTATAAFATATTGANNPATATAAAAAAATIATDNTAPAAPVISTPLNNTFINNATPTISGSNGSTEAGTTITIFDTDGVTVLRTTQANAAGAWTLTSTVLGDGIHLLTAKATDTAGNISPVSASVSITIDTLAPASPVLVSPVAGPINTNTPVVSGLAGSVEANAFVEVFEAAGNILLSTTTAANDGSWTTSTPPLAEGLHILVVQQTDAAGNVSATTAQVSITVDTITPAAPVIDASVPTIIHINSFTINGLLGSVEASRTVEVFDTNTTSSLGTVVAAADGSWSITIVLADGTYTLEVKQTDAAGNASPAAQISVVVNRPPVANAGLDFTHDEQITITLNGSGSSDSDGTITSYAWMQTAGTPVTITDPYAAITTFTSPTTTVNTIVSFNLTVTDNHGATAADTVNFTINPVNIVPSANAGTNQTVFESSTVTLDGSASTDVDGNITLYNWSQVNGINVIFSDVNAIQPTFMAPVVIISTVLEFSLHVIDNESGSHTSAVVSVTVEPLPRTMRGHVIDINSAAAVSGAIVTLPDGTMSAPTDSYGAFIIIGLAVEEYPIITASMAGSYTSSNQYAIASDKTDVQFKLIPVDTIDAGEVSGCILGGTVIDAYTMLPIPNVDFYLSHLGADNTGGTVDDINKFVASSDPYGTYAITNIPRLSNHVYHTGSLVGQRRDNRNKEYEGNSDYTFTCDPYTAVPLVQDYALHLVVPNTQIIGKLIDPYTGQPLNQAFDIEIHRRHDPYANTSNWIDDSLKLDSSGNPYVNYNPADGSFTIGELAGGTIYDFSLNSLYYAGFSTFVSRTLYPSMEQITPAGQTLDVGTLNIVASNKADQVITLPVDGYTTAGSILNFTWTPNTIPGVNSFVFVVYEEASTVPDSNDPSIIMPQGSMYLTASFPATESGFTFDFSAGVAAAGAITGPANFVGMTEINGPSPLNTGVNYYWAVYGVTDVYNTPGITNDLNNKTLSFPDLGLNSFQLQ